jgi:hypothetical protein
MFYLFTVFSKLRRVYYVPKNQHSPHLHHQPETSHHVRSFIQRFAYLKHITLFFSRSIRENPAYSESEYSVCVSAFFLHFIRHLEYFSYHRFIRLVLSHYRQYP